MAKNDMEYSEIWQKLKEYNDAIKAISDLKYESRIVMSDYIRDFNGLISQFATLFGNSYDEVKDKLKNSRALQKSFAQMADEINTLKTQMVELNAQLDEQRVTYHVTADEQQRCLKFASQIANSGAWDEFIKAHKDYNANLQNLNDEEREHYKNIFNEERKRLFAANIRTDKERDYILALLDGKNTLTETLELYKNIDERQTSIRATQAGTVQVQENENRILTRREKIYDNMIRSLRWGLGTLKQWGSEWAIFNDLAVKSGRAIGMNNENLRNYNLKLLKDTTQLSHLYGITREQWIGFQNAYAESTSKATLLARDEIENVGAVSKLTSNEIVNQAIANMDALGGSSDNAMAQVAMTHQRAMQLGLNASKLAKDTVNNWGLAQKFTFKNGVDGISRMTALSERLKFNMESIAQVAEGLQSVEGSIQTAARLQMLGGQYARNFSNPMEIMYESNYDMEGLTERIARTFEGQGVFNTKTGKVDISAINQRFIREAAKAMGISADEAFNIATQNAKYNQVMSEASPLANFDENQKQLIANLAKWDAENKTHYLTIQTENGETKNVNVKDLTAKDLANASQLDKNTADINKNVYDIKNGVDGILELAKQRANDQRSFIEKWLGIGNSFKGATSTAADWYMNPLDNKTGWFTKRGGWGETAFNYVSENKWPLFLGALGLTGLGIAKGYVFKKHEGSFGKWLKDYWLRRRMPSFGGDSGTPTGGTPSGGFWSKTKNAGRAVGRVAWRGIKGIGRGLGKIWKPLAAITALIAGGMALSSSSKGVSTENINETPQTISLQTNQEVSTNPTLTELQKQTALLEDISDSGVYVSKQINGVKPNVSVNVETQPYIERQSIATPRYEANVNTTNTQTPNTVDKVVSVGDAILGGNDTTLSEVGIMGATLYGTKKIGNYAIKKATPLAAKAGLAGKAGRTLVGAGRLAAGIGGITTIGGYALDAGNNFAKKKGWYKENSTADKVVTISADALKGAGLGMMFGPWGAAIGGLIGAGFGVYKKYGDSIKNWIKGKTDKAEEAQVSNIQKVMNDEYNANAVPLTQNTYNESNTYYSQYLTRSGYYNDNLPLYQPSIEVVTQPLSNRIENDNKTSAIPYYQEKVNSPIKEQIFKSERLMFGGYMLDTTPLKKYQFATVNNSQYYNTENINNGGYITESSPLTQNTVGRVNKVDVSNIRNLVTDKSIPLSQSKIETIDEAHVYNVEKVTERGQGNAVPLNQKNENNVINQTQTYNAENNSFDNGRTTNITETKVSEIGRLIKNDDNVNAKPLSQSNINTINNSQNYNNRYVNNAYKEYTIPSANGDGSLNVYDTKNVVNNSPISQTKVGDALNYQYERVLNEKNNVNVIPFKQSQIDTLKQPFVNNIEKVVKGEENTNAIPLSKNSGNAIEEVRVSVNKNGDIGNAVPLNQNNDNSIINQPQVYNTENFGDNGNIINAIALKHDNDANQMGLHTNVENPRVESIPIVGSPTQIVKNTYRETITDKIVVPDINLNVNGTIKLTADNGKSADIDFDKLMNNPQFKSMIIKMVKDGLDRNQNNGKVDRNSTSNLRVSSGYSSK